jgi:hypothetical protein
MSCIWGKFIIKDSTLSSSVFDTEDISEEEQVYESWWTCYGIAYPLMVITCEKRTDDDWCCADKNERRTDKK